MVNYEFVVEMRHIAARLRRFNPWNPRVVAETDQCDLKIERASTTV
jgi:hypothetical protein